jgi:hypothetical protein
MSRVFHARRNGRCADRGAVGSGDQGSGERVSRIWSRGADRVTHGSGCPSRRQIETYGLGSVLAGRCGEPGSLCPRRNGADHHRGRIAHPEQHNSTTYDNARICILTCIFGPPLETVRPIAYLFIRARSRTNRVGSDCTGLFHSEGVRDGQIGATGTSTPPLISEALAYRAVSWLVFSQGANGSFR